MKVMKSYIYNKVVMRLVMGLLPFYLLTFGSFTLLPFNLFTI